MATVSGDNESNLKWFCDSCNWSGDFKQFLRDSDIKEHPRCPNCLSHHHFHSETLDQIEHRKPKPPSGGSSVKKRIEKEIH